jgi:hypothetical protein
LDDCFADVRTHSPDPLLPVACAKPVAEAQRLLSVTAMRCTHALCNIAVIGQTTVAAGGRECAWDLPTQTRLGPIGASIQASAIGAGGAHGPLTQFPHKLLKSLE